MKLKNQKKLERKTNIQTIKSIDYWESEQLQVTINQNNQTVGEKLSDWENAS